MRVICWGPGRDCQLLSRIKAESSPGCFGPRPGISLEDPLQGGMWHLLVPIHGTPDESSYVREADAPIHKSFDGDLIGGVQYRRQGSADFPGLAGQFQCRKPARVGFLEGETAQLCQVGADAAARRTVRARGHE